MSSSGPNNPASVTTSSSLGTNNGWSSTSNCFTENASYASCYSGGGTDVVSYGLVVTNFGFSIPAGNTIDGIVVEVKTYGERVSMSWGASRIVKGGTIQSTDVFPSPNTYPSSLQYVTLGTSSQLWGTTWDYTDINASNFGFAFSIKGSNTGTDWVDHVRITVYYSAGGGGGAVSSLIRHSQAIVRSTRW